MQGNTNGKAVTNLRSTTVIDGMSVLLFSYDQMKCTQGVQDKLARVSIPELGRHVEFYAEMEDAQRIDAIRGALVALLKRFAAQPSLEASNVEAMVLMTYPMLFRCRVDGNSQADEMLHADQVAAQHIAQQMVATMSSRQLQQQPQHKSSTWGPHNSFGCMV